MLYAATGKIAYMDTIGSRIRIAREAAGINQRELGDACGVSRAAVSQWEAGATRSPTPENIFAIAAKTGFSAKWLITGKGQMREPAPEHLAEGQMRYSVTEPDASESHQNIEPVGYHNNDMPLISFVNAGTWCESPDNFAPGDAEEWLPRPKGVGARAFALRVEGDSMTSPYPGQRSYPNGALIYVDPDRALTNGARVIARTPGGEYTFKVYTEDAGRRYLKPINPQYPMIDITEHTHICGVVVGAYMPE